jgi:hypothetical protein
VDTTSGVEVGAGVETPIVGRVQAKSPRKKKSKNRFIYRFVYYDTSIVIIRQVISCHPYEGFSTFARMQVYGKDQS